MASDRARIQGVVLVEDRRTERFLRHLLSALGFETRRKVKIKVAPRGRGAAESWVKKQYPSEVRFLRRSHPIRFLLAARDGDAVGVSRRKADLDEALMQDGQSVRASGERIATPVPTWSIENWIFDLLGTEGVNEERQPEPGNGPSWKQLFDQRHGGTEKDALRSAAAAWKAGAPGRPELPSLVDGRAELTRIDP